MFFLGGGIVAYSWSKVLKTRCMRPVCVSAAVRTETQPGVANYLIIESDATGYMTAMQLKQAEKTLQ